MKPQLTVASATVEFEAANKDPKSPENRRRERAVRFNLMHSSFEGADVLRVFQSFPDDRYLRRKRKEWVPFFRFQNQPLSHRPAFIPTHGVIRLNDVELLMHIEKFGEWSFLYPFTTDARDFCEYAEHNGTKVLVKFESLSYINDNNPTRCEKRIPIRVDSEVVDASTVLFKSE